MYLANVRGPVRQPEADDAARSFTGSLPEEGSGTLTVVRQLLEQGTTAHVRSGGPRFFHWVIGGSTPAALAADWFAVLIDQNAGAWDMSPIAAQLEELSLAWLQDLFGLPQAWGGVLTTGATTANFAALAAARQWWGEQQRVDVATDGLVGLPRIPVFTSGFVHASSLKALAMLGIGQAGPVLQRRRSRSPRSRPTRARVEASRRRAFDRHRERRRSECWPVRPDRGHEPARARAQRVAPR